MKTVRSRPFARIGMAISVAAIALCFLSLCASAIGCYEDLYVLGAGSSVVNGRYLFENMFFGKAAYTIDMKMAVYWFAPHNRWIIEDDAKIIYYANDSNTDTPPSTGWYLVNGVGPAPTMNGGDPCSEPPPPPDIEVIEAGGEAGSFLDHPLPLDEGEDPPMVGTLPLCGVFEVGDTIAGGCTILGAEGRGTRGSYIHLFLYSVDATGIVETITLLDHWMVRYNYVAGEYVFEVDTAGLAPGYYDIRLTFANGSAQVLRVQVTG